jgi:hypothetical protein
LRSNLPKGATARHFRCHLRKNAFRRFSISAAVSA